MLQSLKGKCWVYCHAAHPEQHPNFPVWRNFTTMLRSACSLISDGQTFRYKLAQDCPPLLLRTRWVLPIKISCLLHEIPRELSQLHTRFFRPPNSMKALTGEFLPTFFFKFFFFLLRQTVPFGLQMNYWMLMNKMVVAGSKALRGKMVWNSTYVNLSNMIM